MIPSSHPVAAARRADKDQLLAEDARYEAKRGVVEALTPEGPRRRCRVEAKQLAHTPALTMIKEI